MAAEIEVELFKKATKTKSRKLGSESDAVWKECLNIFFKDITEYAWPNIHEDIDWDQGYEILEQEFHSIHKLTKKDKRVVDKLIKVKRKNGEEAFVLVHIEVQKRKELDFSERIFIYRNRILDKFQYRFPVVSLGVLIDSDLTWYPSFYESELWGCKTRFEYPILKLIDQETEMEKLFKSENPFALLAYFQLMAIKTSYDLEKRYNVKFSLSRQLFDRGWDRDRIELMLKFLEGLMLLPDEFQSRYRNELNSLEEDMKMVYRSPIDRMVMKEAQTSMLLLQLETKFKEVPEKYKTIIQKANSNKLLVLGKRLLAAETIDEVFSTVEH